MIEQDVAVAVLGDNEDEKPFDSSYSCQFPRQFCADDAYKFKRDFKSTLITSVEQFRQITDNVCDTWLAGDTETDGVDHDRHRICGFSFSFTPYDGYYVPIRHQAEDQNLPEEEIIPLILDFIYRNKWLFYHWSFDGMMLKREGCVLDRIPKVLDVRALVYNADTNIKKNNLKWAAKWFLNRDSPTFEETVGGKDNTFDMLLPEEAYDYACQDTANTMGVFKQLAPYMNMLCPTIIKIDCQLACAMAEYYIDNPLWLNNEAMERLGVELRQQRDALAREILGMMGRSMQNPINLDSNDQVAEVLISLGIHTGAYTDGGQMSVDKDALSQMDHPLCTKLVEYSHVGKQLNSYVDKLSHIEKGHINYKIFFNTTGRLASGSEKEEGDNSFYLPLNYQNFTKPSQCLYHRTFEGDDPDNTDLILGYRFRVVSSQEAKDLNPDEIFEGPSPILNVRTAVTVPHNDRKSWYFVALDYSQEELRIIGGMSQDPVYMKAFREKSDIYRTVGAEMFGCLPHEITKAQRKKAKVAVLGLNYGGSGFTLHRSSKLPLNECDEIAASYRRAANGIETWKAAAVAKAQSEHLIEWLGTDDLEPNSPRNVQRRASAIPVSCLTRTAYGRPRWVGHWLGSPDAKQKAFGIRTIPSHKVQGTAGDVMRIVLVELYQKIFKKYPDLIRFVGCVHDEVDLAVRKDSLHLLDEVKQIMTITPPGCACDLPVDPEIGYNYGYLFPFKKNAEGVWS